MYAKVFILSFLLYIELTQGLNLGKSQSFLQEKVTEQLYDKFQEKYADRTPADSNPPPLPANFTGLDVADETKMTEIEFMNVWKGYHLSQGEIKDLFNTLDYKKQNYVTVNAWKSFYNDFLTDFTTNCDATADFLMDAGEVKACLDSPVFTMSEKTTNPDFPAKLMNLMFESQNMLNFADYMFLRRSNLAWEKCAVENLLSSNNMECALTIISQGGRRLGLPESTVVFNLAHEIQVIKPQLIDNPYLEFLIFFEIARTYWYFSQFEFPLSNGVLSLTEMNRAVNQQITPYQFTNSVVKSMFEGVFNDNVEKTSSSNKMDFKNFAQVYRYLRIFMKYTGTVQKDIKGRVNLDEYKNEEMDPLYAQSSENMLIADHEDSQDAQEGGNDDEQAEKPVSVDDFLISFTQEKSKTKSKQQNEGPIPPDSSDHDAILFTMFDSTHSGLLKFGDLCRLLKFQQLFITYDTLNKGQIGIKEINFGLRNLHIPLPITNDDESKFTQLNDFILTRQLKVNMKGFISWFMYKEAFNDMTDVFTPDSCVIDNLKHGLGRLSLKLTSLKGIDSSIVGNNKTIYQYKKAYEMMLVEEQENIIAQYKKIADEANGSARRF